METLSGILRYSLRDELELYCFSTDDFKFKFYKSLMNFLAELDPICCWFYLYFWYHLELVWVRIGWSNYRVKIGGFVHILMMFLILLLGVLLFEEGSKLGWVRVDIVGLGSWFCCYFGLVHVGLLDGNGLVEFFLVD